ncbi:MAG: precorrin-2 dehydrogenase/sirohydrochlorin ferrochelatase family protein [Bacillota bacterium]
MAEHYPIALDLAGRKVLVVGGGAVAARKVEPLLTTGAEITVVSPQLSARLEELVNETEITYRQRVYSSTDIEDKFLVISATDEQSVNQQVAEDGLAQDKLVNIVDQPELSNFNVPAVVKEGSLCISIATDGKSPALSGQIRRRLETEFGKEYQIFLDWMGDLRSEIIAQVEDIKDRNKIFKQLVNSDILNLLAQGDKAEALRLMNQILPAEIDYKEDVDDK